MIDDLWRVAIRAGDFAGFVPRAGRAHCRPLPRLASRLSLKPRRYRLASHLATRAVYRTAIATPTGPIVPAELARPGPANTSS